MSEENITINKFNLIKSEKVTFIWMTVIISQNMVPDTYQCLINYYPLGCFKYLTAHFSKINRHFDQKSHNLVGS